MQNAEFNKSATSMIAMQGASRGSNFKFSDTPLDLNPVTQGEVNEALALFQSARVKEAFERAQLLLRRDPDVVPLLELSGAALRKLGKLQEAYPFFERSLQVSGPSAHTHFNIGILLFDLCRYSDAAQHLTQALEFDPKNQNMAQTLGLCLNAMGRYLDTVNLLTPWLKPGQANGATLNILGLALYHLNCFEEAEFCYNAVNEPPQEVAEAQSHLGVLAKAQGDTQKARLHYIRALELAPTSATAHRNLSAVTQYEPGHPHLEALKILAKQPGQSTAKQIEIEFALYKAHQDIKDFETAFTHLKRGNHLKRDRIGYSIEADEALFAHLRQVFDKPAPEAHSALPFRPIFIVGLPRSGTTLTEQILCGCDGVTGAGELQYATTAMVQHLQEMNLSSENSMPAEQVAALRAELSEKMMLHSKGAPVLIDKMPLNLRWVGPLLAAFPEARVVHTTRSAADNCWSLYKVCFQGDGNGFAYDLEAAERFHSLSMELMQHWNELYPDRIHHLDHELLTKSPEEQARALVDFCDLEWSENCLHPERQTQAILTASALQVRKPIYRKKTPDWTPYQAQLAAMSDLFRTELE